MIKKITFLILLVLSSLGVTFAQQVLPNDQRPIAFTHITVIDATGSPAQPDTTVVITGNHITAIGKQAAVPKGAQVIDARGKFLIPGLMEMHTHAFIRSRKSFPLYVMYLLLANGVTTARDMGSPGEKDDFGDYPFVQDLEWRQAIESGSILGPRLILSLTILNGPRAKGYPRGWLGVADAAQAREAVDYLKGLGADMIKIYDQLPRDAYFAIADESKKQGLPFAGHVPIVISAAEASDAGQRSLEHDYSVLFGCSTREKEFMEKENALYGMGKPAMRGLLAPEDVKGLIDSYSPSKAADLFAKFVKNNTFVTPSFMRAIVDRPGTADPNYKYFSPALREYSNPPNATRKAPDPAVREAQLAMYAYHHRLAKAMQDAGVKLLVGTDNSFFGSAVHDELVEFVNAGLTPMQALQTATKNAADNLGKLDTMGTVEKGKLADLVVLDADPLANIANVRKISSVVINGRLLDRQTLDRMLAQVESPNHPVDMSK